MTGENFRNINRHDQSLDKLINIYYQLCDESYTMVNYEEDFDYEKYYNIKKRQYKLANDIFAKALYHYKDWNIAKEFCKRKNIEY